MRYQIQLRSQPASPALIEVRDRAWSRALRGSSGDHHAEAPVWVERPFFAPFIPLPRPRLLTRVSAILDNEGPVLPSHAELVCCPDPQPSRRHARNSAAHDADAVSLSP